MLIVLAGGVARAQSGAATATPAPKRAEEVYKNIQVLKGIPADQMLPTMQLITTSLGTQCNHCHVEGANERDDKGPKEFARIMMQMVFGLNKNVFGGRQAITCYTCHHGNLRPVSTIDPADMGRPSQVPGLVGNQPGANLILDKYLAAMGGEDAVAKITSRVARGKIESAANNPAPVELYFKSPDHGLLVTHILGNDSSTVYSGNSGWTSSPVNGTQEMTAAETEAAKLEDTLYLAANAKKTFRWRVAAPEMVGDKNAYVLDGSAPGHVPLRLYLDQQTGLLLRLMHFIETPFGTLPAQLDYDDYRDVDGVKTPFRISAIRPNARNTIQWERVQQNVPIEDAKFSKPPAPEH